MCELLCKCHESWSVGVKCGDEGDGLVKVLTKVLELHLADQLDMKKKRREGRI
jgi:hypothetical protein